MVWGLSGCYLPYEGTWTPLWDFATSRGVVTALKLKTEFKSNRQMLAAQEKIIKIRHRGAWAQRRQKKKGDLAVETYDLPDSSHRFRRGKKR